MPYYKTHTYWTIVIHRKLCMSIDNFRYENCSNHENDFSPNHNMRVHPSISTDLGYIYRCCILNVRNVEIGVCIATSL